MKHSLIVDHFVSQYGFNPRGIYCAVTGKMVGMTLNEEFVSLVESLSVEGEADAEQIADDIAIRIFSSMRPSMRWNSFKSDGIKTHREKHPVETLAYLVNRMFAPIGWRKMGLNERLASNADKIRAYSIIESWGVNDATNTLLYMLLEIDAKWSLDTESAPFSWMAFFLNAPDMDARVSMLQSWYATRMEAWAKRVKAEEMQVKWTRHGNAVSKPAFQAAFMENRPLSVTAIKQAEKVAEKTMWGDLLFEIMGKPTLEGEQTLSSVPSASPTFVPIRKNPMRFGVKKGA